MRSSSSDLNPAETPAGRTIETLTFGAIPRETAVFILAVWEVAIGIGLMAGRWMRAVLALLFVQMLGTITPLFLFPTETFTEYFPFVPTLEGQYIIKNIVLVSAGDRAGCHGARRGAESGTGRRH